LHQLRKFALMLDDGTRASRPATAPAASMTFLRRRVRLDPLVGVGNRRGIGVDLGLLLRTSHAPRWRVRPRSTETSSIEHGHL
jgi:hypothetical protein